MEGQAKKPVFLERASYRQRRLRDLARLLPVLGAILFVLPLMWKLDGNEGLGTSDVMVYLFAIWLGLIAASALLARAIRPEPGEDRSTEEN